MEIMKSSTAQSITLTHTETIRRPPGDVYRFWRDFGNLAQVMDERVTVAAKTATRSHWTVRAPGHTVEWDAEMVRDEPDREIAWRSVPNAVPRNFGSVRFEPEENGKATSVTLTFDVTPPGGVIWKMAGHVVARYIGTRGRGNVTARQGPARASRVGRRFRRHGPAKPSPDNRKY